jgi:transcription elongation GreA/GreB family factor
MDKRDLVGQLETALRDLARQARQASIDAATEARDGVTSAERRKDARGMLEYGGLARGQKKRAERAERELETLLDLETRRLGRGDRIGVGAVVEVEDDDTGEGRTFFLAPAGAGIRLTGPGGDGDLTVVTPGSPIGRAVLGKRVGDVCDVTVRGDVREWTITWVE